MGWISRLLVVSVVGYAGYSAYYLHRAGFFGLPDLPDGAFTVSFSNGFRGIVQGLEVSNPRYADGPAIFKQLTTANPDRLYIGFPMKVASGFKEAWSTCAPPTKEERPYTEGSMPDEMKRRVYTARFDAICYIDTDDNQRVLRGALYSVPHI